MDRVAEGKLLQVTADNYWSIRTGVLYLLRQLDTWERQGPKYPMQIECAGTCWTVCTVPELERVVEHVEVALAVFEPQRRAWPAHQFTVEILLSVNRQDAMESLLDAHGCDDADHATTSDGRQLLRFSRRARTREEAIQTALGDVANAGFRGEVVADTAPPAGPDPAQHRGPAAVVGAIRQERAEAEQRAAVRVADHLIAWCAEGDYSAAAALLGLLEVEPAPLAEAALAATERGSAELSAARTSLQAALISRGCPARVPAPR